LASAGLDQPGLLEAFQHQAQQLVGPALLREAGAELRQSGEVEARVVQFETERVFPGDTVCDGLGGLTVGEVVPELQDGHDQEERRGQTRLPERGVHALELARSEVLISEQRTQSVPDPHLIGPPRMHPPSQRSRVPRDLPHTHRPQHSPPPTQATLTPCGRASPMSHTHTQRLRQRNQTYALRARQRSSLPFPDRPSIHRSCRSDGVMLARDGRSFTGLPCPSVPMTFPMTGRRRDRTAEAEKAAGHTAGRMPLRRITHAMQRGPTPPGGRASLTVCAGPVGPLSIG
jgi:hypothetical protein